MYFIRLRITLTTASLLVSWSAVCYWFRLKFLTRPIAFPFQAWTIDHSARSGRVFELPSSTWFKQSVHLQLNEAKFWGEVRIWRQSHWKALVPVWAEIKSGQNNHNLTWTKLWGTDVQSLQWVGLLLYIEEDMHPADAQKINKGIVVRHSSVFIHIKRNVMFSLTRVCVLYYKYFSVTSKARRASFFV